MQLQPISHSAPPEVWVATEDDLIKEARKSFWEFRVLMNPRLLLRNMWFPKKIARQLRKFYDDYKAGKRPVLLLMTPPQHGKSLTVIDFIAWAIGHDPELRVIYSSFSDRLGVRANLRLQRITRQCDLQANFSWNVSERQAYGDARRSTLAQSRGARVRRHEGYFRNTTVLGSITGEALDLGVIDDPSRAR